jgi:hypothetical protein
VFADHFFAVCAGHGNTVRVGCAGKVSEESDIDIIFVPKAFEGTCFIKRMGEVVRKPTR